MEKSVAIVPSILPSDFAKLGSEIEDLEQAGVDKIQFDVMDGHFVPNLTFGAEVIGALRKYSTLPFEAHLMIEAPEETFERYIEAGCDLIIIHAESTKHLDRTLNAVKAGGAKVGVALNPATHQSAISYVLDLVDLVLVMTVNPGFGGQSYISAMEPKITAVAEMIQRSGNSIDIEVDGGISPTTIAGAASAGANHLVAGSALYRHSGGLKSAVTELRSLAEAARR